MWQIFSSLLMFCCFNTLFDILTYSETVPRHFTPLPHLPPPPPLLASPHLASLPPHLPPPRFPLPHLTPTPPHPYSTYPYTTYPPPHLPPPRFSPPHLSTHLASPYPTSPLSHLPPLHLPLHTSPLPHLTSPSPSQAIYTLIIYVFFGWERLSRRYRKRNIPQQNGIALTPPRATYKVGSRSPNMTGSKQHLVDEEGEVRKSHDSYMTFSACTYIHTYSICMTSNKRQPHTCIYCVQ